MTSPTAMTAALPTEHRDRLMRLAREVSFDAGTRLFEEGRHADRFWIIRTGTVALDLHVPGRRPAVIESIGRGELVGWSWHFPPFTWHLGAEAMSPVRAWEFDAEAVRAVCSENPKFGRAIAVWVGRVVAQRLHASRVRLLDLYAPYGSGGLT
ncbi:cyclic nucleotide-binding domain-containing protein [Streptomyces sp. NBC_00257]|uniref:Crp/Fnr family transcriptional regulator n=1 Tax=unclassified Streptomyces TaxID=2593676 RepID=UPI0022524789|nr:MULTISPECIES: cyclic nucleotide-binding domain-containing protein [unclassified Streptomyces]WTB58837.1 cyclic nucleotide-binding domain-containing protein [Streptomyces sp. NBC_00826]WTH88286.1 cyclic nucleotide-binding domain-containing protein [Streptomyces sp. NBC_00825]WTH97014.1 cyclic nucleotide-binding domain-containing protein [Streptomyces sp. NBC_00822]MCX4862502.1 cyclic nucleotide-binding domain-containing protein [Streptomyces sp. NBC_00906]MCX4893739.1 cyclic nucleotide-bindi